MRTDSGLQGFLDALDAVLNDAGKPNTHKHLCGACFIVFEHTRPAWDSRTTDEYAADHKCPQCGAGPFFRKYDGAT